MKSLKLGFKQQNQTKAESEIGRDTYDSYEKTLDREINKTMDQVTEDYYTTLFEEEMDRDIELLSLPSMEHEDFDEFIRGLQDE